MAIEVRDDNGPVLQVKFAFEIDKKKESRLSLRPLSILRPFCTLGAILAQELRGSDGR